MSDHEFRDEFMTAQAQCQRFMAQRFDDLKERMNGLSDEVSNLRDDLGSLKVKFAGISAVVGLLAGWLGSIVKTALDVSPHGP